MSKPARAAGGFTNRLVDSASPYLRQHAHNPVDWYPWGPEALRKAREEDKPIFLSIGYATCYWCHVMEREIFENADIAQQMNEWFVNIKVDREERPEIDEIYMIARQLMTRQGGWPNNVVLTPQLKPFFAGGTFAAENDEHGRPGFPHVIAWLRQLWEQQREEIEEVAEQTAQAVRGILANPAETHATPNAEIAGELAAYMKQHHDARAGGFYQAPKFPHETWLLFLLDYARWRGDEESFAIARHSFEALAAGGIYDHVGGGLHRYAVDGQWHVPHFEKMLYNQALFVRVGVALYRQQPDPYARDIVRRTLSFTARELTHPEGGFYSALDAETDAVEGAYYVWEEKDIRALLGSEAEDFLALHGLADVPIFPGHKHPEGKVLYARMPLLEWAEQQGQTYEALAARLEKNYAVLLASRAKRDRPITDDKIIAAWNGLMIAAFAEAGEAFGDAAFITQAERAAEFIWAHLRTKEGDLLRIFSGGSASVRGYLEDYAYVTAGLLALHRAGGKREWLTRARELMAKADALFLDAAQGGYAFTDGSEEMIARILHAGDGALPAPNAVMLHNLLELHALTKEESWKRKAQSLAACFAGAAARTPPEHVTLIDGWLRLAPANGTPSATSKSASPEEKVVAIHVDLMPANKEGWRTLKVTLDIAEGWHINGNQPTLPSLIPTSLDVQGAELGEVSYPEPDLLPHLNTEETIPIYQSRVVFTAQVKPQKGSEMRLRLRYQPCAGDLCLEPVDQIISLPF